MRKGARSFSFICRSLKLLLILLLLSCFVKVSQGQTPKFNLDKITSSDIVQPSLVRKAYLWNICSEKFVQIRKAGSKGVDANGEKAGDFSIVRIISINGGFVRIQGMANNLYLCFNPKGKLRIRYNPPKSGYMCDFSHNLTADGYDTFKLRNRPEWSIGFKKRKGKKLPGYIRPGKNDERCHHFTLDKLDNTVLTQPPGNFDLIQLPHESDFLKKRKKKRKFRHNRKLKRQRGRRRRKNRQNQRPGVPR